MDAMPFVDANYDAALVKTQVTNQLQQIENDYAATLSSLSSKASPKDPTSIVSKLNALNAQKEIAEKAKISINPEDKNMANVISRDVPFPKTYLRFSLIPIDINENYYSEAAFLNTNPLQFLNELQNIAQARSKDIVKFKLAEIPEREEQASPEAKKNNIDVQAMLREIDEDRQLSADIHYSIISVAVHFHIYLQNMYDEYGHTMFIKAKQRIQDLIYPYEGHDPAYNLVDEKRKLIELKSFFGIFAEITAFLESDEWKIFQKDIKKTGLELDAGASSSSSPTTSSQNLNFKAVRKVKTGLYSTKAFSWLSPFTSQPTATKTVFRIKENKARKRIFLSMLSRRPFLGVPESDITYVPYIFNWLTGTVIPGYNSLESQKNSLTTVKGNLTTERDNLLGQRTSLTTEKNNLITDKNTLTTAKTGLENDIIKISRELQSEKSTNSNVKQLLDNKSKELEDKQAKITEQEQSIKQLEDKLVKTEERIRAELIAELTKSNNDIEELGAIDITDVLNYQGNIESIQKIILQYINKGLDNIQHAEGLAALINYDLYANLFFTASNEKKTDIASKMAAIRQSVEKYLSRFYTSKNLLKPMFFLKFVYRHDTFLGKTGVGNIITTFTLGPLEKQEIRVKTSETTREARESSSTIFDTASDSAQKEFEDDMSTERNSSSSSTVDTELYMKASLAVGVEAKGGFPGCASVGATMDASVEGGSKLNTNATHEQAAKNTQNASQKHSSTRQSQRDSTVSEMSQSEKEVTKEEGYIRTIENPNPDVAMNYTFRQIIQEYISTISLVDIKMIFSNGVVVKEAPASEVTSLVRTYIKAEPTFVHENIYNIVRNACKVRDYQDRQISMLDVEENGVFRLRKDSYAKILEDFPTEFDAYAEAPIFDLFKNIFGPLVHFWKFSLVQPGAVMIPEISYGSALGPQAREEFQMKVVNWKNENDSVALQNDSIRVKNDLIREFLKMLPTIQDEKLKVDAIFKLVNQSTEIADKLTILRLMSEGGADVSSIKKSLKLIP
jgi:hypothetical protein